MNKKLDFNIIPIILKELIKPLKLSFIAGSKSAFFSFSEFFTPLLGAYNNFTTTAIICTIQAIIYFIISPYIILHKLPGIVGNLYLSSNLKYMKALLPALYILLFITHSVGSQAWVYSMYWLIPIILSFTNFKNDTINLLAKLLSSSFVTHGTGAIIYLYTKNISPIIWNSLISIVLIERVTLSLGSLCAYYMINYLISSFKNHNLITLKVNEISN